jgi:tryptophan 2,3-dioxygenase
VGAAHRRHATNAADPMPLTRSPVTYSSYLKLDELLGLQRPLSAGPEHDEMLFIVVHQVYELWFKEILHELDYLQQLLARDDLPRALHTLKRILTILKVLVAQLDILETMTPLEFLSFRDRLESGSGFQSFQFREIEFALGLKRPGTGDRYPEGSDARRRLQARHEQPSLWDAFLHYLARNGHDIPGDELGRDVAQPVEPSPEIQRILIGIYRSDPMLSEVCERLVDLDEGVQEWRYRHVKMVQRTIGTKMGTGGTAGAEYLATTLSKPVFPDLWAIRAEL